MADLLDDAIAEALNARLPVAPVDMDVRIERHVARRTRARRTRVAAGTMTALVAITGSAFALSPRGHAGHVEVSQPGDVHSGSTRRGGHGVPNSHSAESPQPHASNGAPSHAVGAGASAGTSAGHDGTGTNASNGNASTGGAPGAGGSPSQPVDPPPAPPSDSTPVTQLAVNLYDDGLHVSAANAIDPAAVSFHDMRSNRAQAETLSTPDGASIADGGSVQTHPGVGPGEFHVQLPEVAPVWVNFVAPVLAAPTEPDNVFTVELHAGTWTLPHRSVGDSAPYVHGIGSPGGGRWTDVHEGTYTLVVLNPDHIMRTFKVPGIKTDVLVEAKDDSKTFTMTITAASNRTWMLEPRDQGYRNAGEGMTLWIQ